MKTYFTSDQHFGHYNIIRLCDRPFSSLEEMNGVMLEKWNAKVRSEDTVYILGDLFFREKNPLQLLRMMNGHKHLVVGNHDHTWMGRVRVETFFESVQMMKTVDVDGKKFTLCHYPMMSYPFGLRGYMVYGHIHGNTDSECWPIIASRPEMLNACVEVNDYAPVTFDELVANNIRFKSSHRLYEG